MGVPPEGNYTFEATTTYNGNAHSSSGRFTVSPLQLEALQTTANHQVLYSLSAQNNGRLVLPQNIAEIPNYIAESGDAKPRLHDTYKTKAVINLKWIFFILLALLSLEWFLRKWNGGY